VFRGVIRAMNGAGNALVRAFGVTPTGGATRVHSASELSLLTAEAVQAGELPAEQGPILERVFGLGAKCVRDVMVPRARVFAAERHTPVDELLDRLREEGFTRLPIYEGDLDHVVGILHTKDLFHVISQTRLVVLEDALRPALEIGPDVTLGKALRTFRREHRHMAIVREPGKHEMLGIVTIEDLLEQIVGAIEDEHD
jgi:CBS domain containing-hemolysin-like protein